MQYQQLLATLEENADIKYRDFHKRLLKNDKVNVIGVRIPILRKIATMWTICFLFPTNITKLRL